MSDLWAFKPQATEAPRLVGFDVEALDGSIGVIERTVLGLGTSHLVVDTGFWNFGKKRMIPAGMIDTIDLERRTVVLNMTKEQVRAAPDFDEARSRDAAYRSLVGQYYDPFYYDPWRSRPKNG